MGKSYKYSSPPGYSTPYNLPRRLFEIAASSAASKIGSNFANYLSPGASTTGTQTISAKTIEKIIQFPNTMKVRKFTLNIGKARREKDATGQIVLYTNYSKLASTTHTGKQLVSPWGNFSTSLFPRYFNKDFILGDGSTAATHAAGPWADGQTPLYTSVGGGNYEQLSLFELNPNVNITGGGWLTSANTNPNPNDVIILKSIDETITLKNFTSTACDFQIYWFLCTSATSKHPTDLWYDSLNAKEMEQAAVTVATTSVKPTAGFSNDPNYFPGLEIWKEKLVKKFWKVLRVEAGTLAGGDEVKFLIDINFNRGIKKLNVESQPEQYIPGLSICPVFIANGGLVVFNPATNADVWDAETSSRVTTSRLQLGTVNTRQYTFVPVSHADRYDYNVISTQLITSDVVSDFKTIDPKDGDEEAMNIIE